MFKIFEIHLSENLSAVNAQEIPRFLVEPSDTNVVEYENTEISCSATGVPVPTIVSWMKDGIHIVLDGTKSILTSGALRITNAGKSDDGYYQCVARNILASVISRRAKLNVACKFNESRVEKFLFFTECQYIFPPKNTNFFIFYDRLWFVISYCLCFAGARC